MKGSVKIQLFDKDGNLASQVEDHNMLTNFIQNYFKGQVVGNGRYSGNSYSDQNSKLGNLLHKFFGTLQIFGETLSEDPNDYFANGQKVIGLATYNASYSGSRPFYGNYNGAESGWTDEKTFKYVYDFPTSQGNGTIKALGLSPITANGHGFGIQGCDEGSLFDYSVSNKSFQVSYFTDNDGNMMNYPRWNYDSSVNFGVLLPVVGIPNKGFIAVIKNPAWTFFSPSHEQYFGKTSSIQLYKFPWVFDKLGFGKLATMMAGYGVRQTLESYATIELKNPLNTNSENYGFYNYANGKIYALYANNANWNPNVELNMTVYDIATDGQSVIKIRNTTGKTIKLTRSGQYTAWLPAFCGFCNGEYLFIRTTENKCYSINITDQSDVKGFKTFFGDEWTFTSDSFCYFHQSKDCVFMCGSHSNYYDNYGNFSTIYSFNLKTGYVSEINERYVIATITDTQSYIVPIVGKYDLVLRHNIFNNSGNSQYTPFVYRTLAGLCLSTKMNLVEPVVKTADFSMKVTYTIQSEPIG